MANRSGPGVTGIMIAVGIISVFTNALMLTGPLFMLQVYDRVLASRSVETLTALFALVAGLYALYALFEYARSRAVARVGAKVQSIYGPPVLRALLEQSALKRQQMAGSVQDLDAVRNFMGSPVLLALFDLPWTPLFIAAIFIFHPLLGWLAVAGGLILVVVALANQVLTARRTQQGNRLTGSAQGFARSALDRSEYVWAQGMQHSVLSRFARAQDEALSQSMAASDWTGSFSSFTKAFRLFLQSAMLALGAWLVLRQELTPGAMIAGSILLGRALAPIDMAIGQWPMVQRARQGWADIKALLGARPAPEAPTELPVPVAHLEIRNVSVIFRPTDPPVLSSVSFEVQPGQAIGVIGRSGSGKSTLARVMAGLLKPVQGDVRLGGASLVHYGSETLGRHVGYLPQDIQLFEATIAENIAQLDLEPDAARLVAAAQKARVHDIILGLPDGYDTVIGPDSAQLSGGQKQRLALARALYNDPVMLILDEPNSALDADGSDALNAAVTQMKADGKSVVIMTHRPAAIQCCDNLVVMERGKVSTFGPRDEVIRAMMKNADQVKRSVTAGGAS